MNAKLALKFSIRMILRNSPFLFNALPAEIRSQLVAIKFFNPSKGYGGRGTQMYMACRHIKPNGLRCKSPAMRGHSFCYFHAKLHTRTSNDAAKFGPITLPVLEDPAAIQIAISRIFDAMLNGRIEGKLAGRLLYGLQIASQHARPQLPRYRRRFSGIDDPIKGRRRARPRAPRLQRARYLCRLQIRKNLPQLRPGERRPGRRR